MSRSLVFGMPPTSQHILSKNKQQKVRLVLNRGFLNTFHVSIFDFWTVEAPNPFP
jgi:hypothetical protein